MGGFGLTGYIPILIYIGGWAAALASLRKPRIGLYVLVPILPFQNVIYRMHEYPLGKDFIDFLFLAILIGWLWNVRQDSGAFWFASRFTKYALGLILVSGLSLIIGSLMWGLPLPLSLGDPRFLGWKNFIMLPILYFLVVNVIRTRQEILILMCAMVGGLFLADMHYAMIMRYTDLSAFSWERKVSGILKTIGGNELAAFYTHYVFLPIGLFFYLKNWLYRISLAGLVAFTTFPIMFLFSRGAYAALALGLLFVGVRKSRLLLVILLVVVALWAVILPSAMVERLEMTDAGHGEIDHSAASRLDLWAKCVEHFFKDPLFGVGFMTFGQFGGRNDPHNAYFEILAEQGAAGVLIFLGIFWFSFRQGLWLMKHSTDPWFQGLGLGLAGVTVAISMTNMFGDRWTYIQLNPWFWSLVALVVRARYLAQGELVEEKKALRLKQTRPRARSRPAVTAGAAV